MTADMEAEYEDKEEQTNSESASLERVPEAEDGSGAIDDAEEDEDGDNQDQDGLSEAEDNSDDESTLDTSKRKNKLRDAALNVESRVKKSGVVYLSTIPPGMNVAKLREIMCEYGKIGRLYLEPDLKGNTITVRVLH